MVSKLHHTLEKALKHHKANRLAKARPLYQKVLKGDPGNVDALHMLGVLYHQSGNHDKALTLLRRAQEQCPGDPVLLTNLGNLLQSMDRLNEAIATFESAIALNPGLVIAHEKLGAARYQNGNLDKAIECYREVIKLDPAAVTAFHDLAKLSLDSGDANQAISYLQRILEIDNNGAVASVARHMLASLQGDTTRGAPAEYITKLFDNSAEIFDKVLVESLHYIVPEALKQAIDSLQPLGDVDDGSLDIVDLGCGTGLCGPLFRDRARTLTGIDLSRKMLAKAKDRNVYDELIEDDVVSALVQKGKSYDIVLAADVFIYVGDLVKVFSAVAYALKTGGLFAYSVENADDGTNFVLRPTGRYAHSLPYLTRLASEAGLEEVYLRQTVLRYEHDQPIDGHILTLRQPS